MSIHYYDTTIGKLGIIVREERITHILFDGQTAPETEELAETAVHRLAAEQLKQYLSGERSIFDLPLAPEGTAFQKKVWDALLNIPCGQTASYKDIAMAVGNPKACRAVGMANRCNPIPIVIPCHRVVGADGSLTGFGGGLPLKEKLLALEAAQLPL